MERWSSRAEGFPLFAMKKEKKKTPNDSTEEAPDEASPADGAGAAAAPTVRIGFAPFGSCA